MNRHGWVRPLPGGAVARCGGSGMCAHCRAEVLAARGCPTIMNAEDVEACFYCGAESAIEISYRTGEAVALEVPMPHADDCPWPPFEAAYR